MLLNALRQAFGDAEQLQATKALEQFFELRRGRTTLQEWSVDWQLKYEEAMTHTGLEIHDVAKTYLYFKASGLPQKTVDDIMLQVHGHMRRFEEARTLMLRLAHRSFDQSNAAPTLHYGEAAENETDFENSWSNVSDYWTEQDWNDAMMALGTMTAGMNIPGMMMNCTSRATTTTRKMKDGTKLDGKKKKDNMKKIMEMRRRMPRSTTRAKESIEPQLWV